MASNVDCGGTARGKCQQCANCEEFLSYSGIPLCAYCFHPPGCHVAVEDEVARNARQRPGPLDQTSIDVSISEPQEQTSKNNPIPIADNVDHVGASFVPSHQPGGEIQQGHGIYSL